MWLHTVTHGRGPEGKNGELSVYPVLFTLPRNMVYPTLLPLMRTPRLPVVDWTDAPTDLNGLVRFAERRNLIYARVPSHFESSLQSFRTKINQIIYTNLARPTQRTGLSLLSSWLRHCATSQKVTGSIPDGVNRIFYWHNTSGRTMALGLTQPLTEMTTRNISGG